MRWRTLIGKQCDFALLDNLICRKFDPNPLLIMGDKSMHTAARFYTPTQGVSLRYQLHRLGFRILLLDEYRTSSSYPNSQGNTKRMNIKHVNPYPWQR
jgi:hypothetical protein